MPLATPSPTSTWHTWWTPYPTAHCYTYSPIPSTDFSPPPTVTPSQASTPIRDEHPLTGQRACHSPSTAYGFIAEIAEVGIGNARNQILGHEAVYQWVNDNGPVDLMRGSVQIQQKFVAAGGRFSLGAIAEHLQKYPESGSAAISTRNSVLFERASRCLAKLDSASVKIRL